MTENEVIKLLIERSEKTAFLMGSMTGMLIALQKSYEEIPGFSVTKYHIDKMLSFLSTEVESLYYDKIE